MMASSQDHPPSRDHQITSSAVGTINNNNNDSSSSNLSNNIHGDGNRDRDPENELPPPPPPPQLQHQATGYPPVIGYPPPGQYPYSGYYSPNHPPFLSQQRPPPPQPFSMPTLASRILAAVMFFVVLSCVISLGAYILLHPATPEFHITGLSITSFSVAPGVSVTGIFEANVTVTNPNEKLVVRFHRIETYFYYKKPGSELAWTTAAPFLMEKNATHGMTVRGSADGDVGGDDAGEEDREAAREMERDWKKGTVEMGVLMGMWTTFRSEGGWWSTRVAMRVQCDGLDVGFAGRSQGSGMWTAGGSPKECSAYR